MVCRCGGGSAPIDQWTLPTRPPSPSRRNALAHATACNIHSSLPHTLAELHRPGLTRAQRSRRSKGRLPPGECQARCPRLFRSSHSAIVSLQGKRGLGECDWKRTPATSLPHKTGATRRNIYECQSGCSRWLPPFSCERQDHTRPRLTESARARTDYLLRVQPQSRTASLPLKAPMSITTGAGGTASAVRTEYGVENTRDPVYR